MAANNSPSGKSSGNTTTQSQLSHKRWYPSLPADTHQDIINAHRFTYDNLYQLRGWTRQLALASGVALEGDSVTANVAGGIASGTDISSTSSSSNTLSSSAGGTSTRSGPSFTSGSQTGPSNSQIMGLNVAAKPPQSGQIPAYNASTGQIEFQGGASSATVNGYTTLPAGIIVQWGNVDMTAGTPETVTFPIPFPSNTFQVYATSVGPNDRIMFVTGSTLTQTTINTNGTGNTCSWLAIGN